MTESHASQLHVQCSTNSKKIMQCGIIFAMVYAHIVELLIVLAFPGEKYFHIHTGDFSYVYAFECSHRFVLTLGLQVEGRF